jgi:dolichol-phosphate mannosyltransferase
MNLETLSVSVVIPTLNEESGIGLTISSVIKELSIFSDYEVIVVDDDSSDMTVQNVKHLSMSNQRIKCAVRGEEKSLGASVGLGAQMASYDIVVIMDSDLTHDPKYIKEMVKLLGTNDLVIGSRFIKGGGMPNWQHFISSKLFNIFIRTTLQTGVNDNLSGFLVFRRRNFSQTQMKLIFKGYGDFAIRLICYMKSLDLRISEYPIHYNSRVHGKSKSNFLKLLFKYGFATFRALGIKY